MNLQSRHANCRRSAAVLFTLLPASLGCACLGCACVGRAHAQAGSTFQDGVTTPPVLTHFVQAEYTQEARRARFAGFGIVLLTVDKYGIRQNVRLTRPIGMGLESSAIKAVKQERFRPATRGGRPVAFPLTIEVSFRPTPGRQ